MENTNEILNPEGEQKLLEMALTGMNYEFIKEMLVKPLAPVILEKQITELVETDELDEETSTPVMKQETRTEMVEANFKKGVVLAIPSGYIWQDPNNHPEVGDIVVYGIRRAIDFDLFRDSQLINPYDVVAFVKKNY